MAPEVKQPEGLLRFPTFVLGQLHRALHTDVEASLRDHWVLVVLDENQDLSQQQVSEALGIDRSDVVRLIDSLEQAGYVVRTRDSADRRRYQLTITQAGKAERTRVDALIRSSTDRLLGTLDAAERHTLHRLALKALGKPEELAD